MYILYKYTLTASLFIIQKILFHIIVLLLKQKITILFLILKGTFFFVFAYHNMQSMHSQKITTAKNKRKFVSAFLLFWACTEGVELYNEYSFEWHVIQPFPTEVCVWCGNFFSFGWCLLLWWNEEKKVSHPQFCARCEIHLAWLLFVCVLWVHTKRAGLTTTSLHVSVYIPYGRRNESPGRYVYR